MKAGGKGVRLGAVRAVRRLGSGLRVQQTVCDKCRVWVCPSTDSRPVNRVGQCRYADQTAGLQSALLPASAGLPGCLHRSANTGRIRHMACNSSDRSTGAKRCRKPDVASEISYQKGGDSADKKGGKKRMRFSSRLIQDAPDAFLSQRRGGGTAMISQ